MKRPDGTNGIRHGHDWQDRQSWLMHREAVRMLLADPLLAERALAILARWDTHVCSRSSSLSDLKIAI